MAYVFIPDADYFESRKQHKIDNTIIESIREIGRKYGFEIDYDISLGIYFALLHNSAKFIDEQAIITKANAEMIYILKTLQSSKRIKFGKKEISNPTFKKWLFDGFIENFRKYLLENPKCEIEKIDDEIEKLKNGDFSDFAFSDHSNEKKSDICKSVARQILDELRGRHDPDEDGNWGWYYTDLDGNEIFEKDWGVYEEDSSPQSKVSIKEAAFIYDLLFEYEFRDDDEFEITTETEKFDRIKRYFKDK